MAAFPPQAYIIGAQKAGTTTLASLLDQHPNIALADPKEPDFYTRHWSKGADWYRGCFKGATADVLLDASTSYAAATLEPSVSSELPKDDPFMGVPGRIKSLRPDAKIIYVLRDPVTRTYSGYWHAVRAGEEKKPFRAALSSNPRLLWASNYHEQLCFYLNHFEQDQILIQCFEDFKTDISDIIKRCVSFVGLTASENMTAQQTHANSSYQYNTLGRIFRTVMPSKQVAQVVTRVVKRLVPKAGQERLKSMMSSPIPPMSDDDRAFLIDYFGPQTERLRKLTGMAFDRWSV